MPEESTKTAKMSKRFGKLKKVFRLGSQSRSRSRSNSPPPFVAPQGVAEPVPPVVAVPPLVSSLAPVHPPPDVPVPPVDPTSPLDLVPTVSATDPGTAAPSLAVVPVPPLVSSSPSDDAPAPVHLSPDIIMPLVDPASPADLEFTASTTDPAPSVDPVSTVTMTLEATKLREKFTHFRILVIGRANAGKTTLLKRVCNTKEDPVYDTINPTDKRGIHNVRDGFVFKSNPGFIFHDSPGFEAGGKKELDDVLSFIQEKAKSKEVEDQIHAIWFCFEPDISRPLLELERTFFNNQRAGNIPVVAIFTKFDVLITRVYDRNKNDEENLKFACETLEKKFEKPLRSYKYPPRGYVRFESIDEDEGNHQEQVRELIKQTTASIDNLALKMLFITIQKNNLEVCIEHAVNQYMFSIDDMFPLIYATASWFGHCYDTYEDYGKKEEETEIITIKKYTRRTRYIGGREFAQHMKPFVKAHYKKPSLPAFAAILICLENSFWHAQQGSTPEDSFKMALGLYPIMEMDKQIMSQWPNNWFSMKDLPSQAECTKFTKFVLANCLIHSESVV